jgi:hypothetical protein
VSNNAAYAFAAGHRARADHSGAFVWGDDSTVLDIASTNTNSVTFRAAGGYRLFPNSGATLGAALALTAWTYKADPDHRRYIGPTTQDFHAAFGLGGGLAVFHDARNFESEYLDYIWAGPAPESVLWTAVQP